MFWAVNLYIELLSHFLHTFSTFCTQSQLLAHFLNFLHTFLTFCSLSQLIAHFLNFLHTFSTFCTLSQLFAHFLNFLQLSQTFSTFSTLPHTFSTFGTLSQLLAHLGGGVKVSPRTAYCCQKYYRLVNSMLNSWQSFSLSTLPRKITTSAYIFTMFPMVGWVVNWD